ncbi:MAG: 1-acyl-sn-glycerol-3-phosphate acyltransferase [Pseudomonadota bacterium]
MDHTITLPLWLVIITALFALWAAISRLLVPGVRWFLRRRANRLIDRMNERMDLRIPPIALTKREVIIDRLVYDPLVIAEVSEYCERENVPRDVAMDLVRRYAKEVAPAFNAYMYFRFGSWISKRVVERLYRVRLGYADRSNLEAVDRNASVVLVMNHRSNIDYVLVAYLVLERVALSYAVGEWARVWPLQQLIRSLGAYFVRRDSGNPLYRRVLQRYVQMAVDGGVTQAIFPEGGLSRDGRLRGARIGLLDYMLRDFDPTGDRDIVFVPVAINYDRVLEDRTLLNEGDPKAEAKSGFEAVKLGFVILARGIRLKLAGNFYRFGYACANFGTPISLKAYAQRHHWQPNAEDREQRFEKVSSLANHLMGAVGELIPVLPVSLLATILLQRPDHWHSTDELRNQTRAWMERLEASGAHVYIPRKDPDYFVEVGLRMLRLRHAVTEKDSAYRVVAEEQRLLAYYANAIAFAHGPRFSTTGDGA